MIQIIEKKIKAVYSFLPEVKKSVVYKKRNRFRLSDVYGDIPYAHSIKHELNRLIIAYLLYLDKKRKINWIKYGFIKDYFPSDYISKDDVSYFITNSMSFRKSFYKAVPYIFLAFIETNNTVNHFNKINNIKEKNYMACELFDLYKIIGQYYLECDGSSINNEVAERYATYMLMLEEALEEKLEENLYESYKTSYKNIKLEAK